MMNEELANSKFELVSLDALEKVCGMAKESDSYTCKVCGRTFKTITAVSCRFSSTHGWETFFLPFFPGCGWVPHVRGVLLSWRRSFIVLFYKSCAYAGIPLTIIFLTVEGTCSWVIIKSQPPSLTMQKSILSRKRRILRRSKPMEQKVIKWKNSY